MATFERPRTARKLRGTMDSFMSLPTENDKSELSGKNLRIFPGKIAFLDIEPGKEYVANILVQNISLSSRRVRVIPPKLRMFQLQNHEGLVPIAPGLDALIEIRFCWNGQSPDTDGDRPPPRFEDHVLITSEEENLQLPVTASATTPLLVFDGFCPFGQVVRGRTEIRYITIINEGGLAADFQLISPAAKLAAVAAAASGGVGGGTPRAVSPTGEGEGEGGPEPVRVEPTRGTLGPRGSDSCSLQLRVELQTGRLEDGAAGGENIRKVFDVLVGGHKVGIIDVSAIISRSALELLRVDGKGRMGEIDLGTVYFAEETSADALLVNDSPEEWHVRANVRLDLRSAESDVEVQPNTIIVEPAEAVLAPYQQLPVRFWYRPRRPAPKRGFRSQQQEMYAEEHSAEIIFACTSADASLSHAQVRVQGKARSMGVELGCGETRFGFCRSGASCDMITFLRNKDVGMPVRFVVPRVAQFKVRPASGKILPLQSMELVLSFTPNALGDHSSVLSFIFNDGAHSLNLPVYGTCDGIAEPRAAPIRGPAAQPADFLPKFSFKESEARTVPVNHTQRLTMRGPKPDLPAWVKNPPLQGKGVDSYSCSVEELQRKQAHRAEVTDYLKQQHRRHYGRRAMYEDSADFQLGPDNFAGNEEYRGFSLDMGMKGIDGLRPPTLALPDTPDPLHRAKVEYVPKLKVRQFDENRLLSTKFPADPETKAERMTCMQKLDPQTLKEISVFPEALLFGDVSFGVGVSKSFAIHNGTKGAIRVELSALNATPRSRSQDGDGDEKYFPVQIHPNAQVIPAGSVAGFDIEVKADLLREIDGEIRYSVNNCHFFSLRVQARPVPVHLKIDPTTRSFTFPVQSTDMFVDETVVVHNKGSSDVEYAWVAGRNFQALQARGIVEAGGMQDSIIRYSPGEAARSEETLQLRIMGGNDLFVTCIGECMPCKVSCVPSILDFGVQSIGLRHQTRAVLKNAGPGPAAFAIECFAKEMDKDAAAHGMSLTVTPSIGGIQPGMQTEVVFTLTTKVPLAVGLKNDGPRQPPIRISIRGGPAVKVGVKADIQAPDIEIVTDEINFGEVCVGNSATQPLRIRNKSVVPARLAFDFSRHKEFSIQVPEHLSVLDDGDSPVRETQTFGDGDSEPETSKGIIQALIKGNSEGELAVVFTPSFAHVGMGASLLSAVTRGASTRSLELPISLLGLLARDLPAQLKRSFRRVVHAVATKAHIQLSVVSPFDFGKRVVVTQQLADKNFCYTISFEVKSLETFPQGCTLRLQQGKDTPLGRPSLKPDGGIFQLAGPVDTQPPPTLIEGSAETTVVLQPMGIVHFYLSFCPRAARPYDCCLQLSLRHDDHDSKGAMKKGGGGQTEMRVEIFGEGMSPSIQFDRNEVLMPTVPLGIPSTVSFYLENAGFDNLFVRLLFADSLPITLSFPEGQTISVAKNRLRVDAKFMTKKPLSLATRAYFLDSDDNAFSITIMAASDNSLLTTFPFWRALDPNLELTGGPGRPIMIGRTASIAQEDPADRAERLSGLLTRLAQARGAAGPAGKEAGMETMIELVAEWEILGEDGPLQEIILWCNAFLFNRPVSSFQALIDNRGKELFEVVSALAATSSSKPSVKARTPPEDKERQGQDDVKIMVDSYEQHITDIKLLGGLVSTVVPEYLLPRGAFFRFASGAGDSSFLGRGREFYQAYHLLLHRASWSIILHQVIRLFGVNRVTPQAYATAMVPFKPSSAPAGGAGSRKPRASVVVAGDTPAETDESKEHVLNGSNSFSVAEVLLLKWLTSLHARIFPRENLFVSDFAQLADCRVLSSAVISYVPSFKETLKSQTSGPNTGEAKEGEERRVSQARRLCSALRDLDLAWVPSPESVAAGQRRALLLLTLELFWSLPGYAPKETIKFDGRLNAAVSRIIELKNPSGKHVTYRVRIEGAEFSSERNLVSIPPRGGAQFEVVHTARFARPSDGRIYFTSADRAAPLVFRLAATVDSYNPTSIVQCETSLYESKVVEVGFTNPFPDDCTFQISLIDAPQEATRGPAGTQRAARSSDGGTTSWTALPSRSFWIRGGRDKAKALRGQNGLLHLIFMPFRLSPQSCLVLLHAEPHGEFCVKVVGAVKLPRPSETLRLTADNRRTVLKDIPVTARNHHLERSRTAVIEVLGKEAGLALFRQLAEHPSLSYRVEYTSPHMSGPKDLLISDSSPGAKGDGVNESSSVGGDVVKSGKLAVAFETKGPGKYAGDVVLRGKTDVRVISVELLVQPPALHAELIFYCPARQAVGQDIPITNQSSSEWTVQAHLNGPQGTAMAFSGPNALLVQANSQATYTIRFRPLLPGRTEATLLLSNSTTGDEYKYTLVGIGEEPLSEDTIVVECEARRRTVRRIPISNVLAVGSGGPAILTLSVKTDLACLTGSSVVRIGAGPTDYELAVQSAVGGTFYGSVTFTDEASGQYFWYMVEVRAQNPKAEKNIQVRTQVRTAVAVDIKVGNPTNDAVEFEVVLSGSGLLGEPSIRLEAGQTRSYQAIFSPLVPGAALGSVSFLHPEMGEFWYEIDMIAEPAPTVQVSPVTADVGGEGVIFTLPPIENLLERIAGFAVVIEGPGRPSFRLETPVPRPPAGRRASAASAGILELEPLERREVALRYLPGSLDQEEVRVILDGGEAGSWIFDCAGRGRPPAGILKRIEVAATLGESTTTTVQFNNPFVEPVQVAVSLSLQKISRDEIQGASGDDQEECEGFVLLLPQRIIEVRPKAVTEIPLMFAPLGLTRHICFLHLRSTTTSRYQGLVWTYELCGVGESRASVALGLLRCRARERFEQRLPVELPGATWAEPEAPRAALSAAGGVKLEVTFPKDSTGAALSRAVKVTLERVRSNASGPGVPSLAAGGSPSLALFVVFEPLRPLRGKIHIVLTHPSGGRWRFYLELAAEAAEPDDVIEIVGSIGKTSSVSFYLTNQFDGDAAFTALVVPTTLTALRVRPVTGSLPPYGTKGCQFIVEFTPSEYGKKYSAQLIIDTAEMQWIYQLHGVFPKYQPPGIVEGKVESHLGAEMEDGLVNRPIRNWTKHNVDAVRAGRRALP